MSSLPEAPRRTRKPAPEDLPGIASRLGASSEPHAQTGALANRRPQGELGGDEVLDRMPHRLVDRDLLRGGASLLAAVQERAELRRRCGIDALELVAPGRHGLERQPALDEEPATVQQL